MSKVIILATSHDSRELEGFDEDLSWFYYTTCNEKAILHTVPVLHVSIMSCYLRGSSQVRSE